MIILSCSCFSFFGLLKGLHLKFHFISLGPWAQSVTLIFPKKLSLKRIFWHGVKSLFCEEKFKYYFKGTYSWQPFFKMSQFFSVDKDSERERICIFELSYSARIIRFLFILVPDFAGQWLKIAHHYFQFLHLVEAICVFI